LADVATLRFVAGETVSQVIARVEQYIFENGLDDNFGSAGDYNSGGLMFMGDPFSRLKYVYTGSNSIPSTDWFW
jgi:hypothetical protein